MCDFCLALLSHGLFSDYLRHSWRVHVSLAKVIEAVRSVGQNIAGADAALAEARLFGFSLFPVLQFSSPPLTGVQAYHSSSEQCCGCTAGFVEHCVL